MNVLVLDIGGTHVKLLLTGQSKPRRFESGPDLSPERMMLQVKAVTQAWQYDAVSIGYPGPVMRNRPVSEPHNLGRGWVGFNFEAAFAHPIQLINDAAMQALGSYKGGRMLFLGLGTGLGNCMIFDGVIAPMEVGHLPYKKGKTFEEYVGIAGYKRLGKEKWQRVVFDVVARLKAALLPDYVI